MLALALVASSLATASPSLLADPASVHEARLLELNEDLAHHRQHRPTFTSTAAIAIVGGALFVGGAALAIAAYPVGLGGFSAALGAGLMLLGGAALGIVAIPILIVALVSYLSTRAAIAEHDGRTIELEERIRALDLRPAPEGVVLGRF